MYLSFEKDNPFVVAQPSEILGMLCVDGGMFVGFREAAEVERMGRGNV